MTVCRRLLDLRHDNIIVPVVKPLRERVLARHDLRPPVLLDLVLIERTGRVALRVARRVLANALHSKPAVKEICVRPMFIWWSRGELNPCPKAHPRGLLRAQFVD